VFLTIVLIASAAFAQRGGGGGGGDEVGGAGMSMPRPQPVSKAQMFADRLKLDKGQKEQVQVILNDAVKEINQLWPLLAKTWAQFAEAILRNVSQDEITKLVGSYSANAAQLTAIEAKTFAKICPMLRPNQQSKAASAFSLLGLRCHLKSRNGRKLRKLTECFLSESAFDASASEASSVGQRQSAACSSYA
jgi:hypothetical protein